MFFQDNYNWGADRLIVNMVEIPYQIRQCEHPDCGLRYPYLRDHPYGLDCPRCGAATRLVLSLSLNQEGSTQMGRGGGASLGGLLDNIRSAWNVGSMFRTADGLGLRHLYLCGISPTPETSKVVKTSLGAEKAVSWSQHNDAVTIVKQLKDGGHSVWALEEAPQAVSIQHAIQDLPVGQVVLVVGNEICGVDPGVLEICDRVVFIPMRGIKRSLNVAVAFGIAAHYLEYGNSR